MEPKNDLYIYDRKEMGVLVLLGLMVALFAFTLGVHLGKRVTPKPVAQVEHGVSHKEVGSVATAPDALPNRQEIDRQSKGVPEAVDQTLTENLRNEVNESGLKIDKPHQVDLPKYSHSKNAGATTLNKAEPEHGPQESAAHRIFTLQIGSYSSVTEAEKLKDRLSSSESKTFIKEVELGDKGKWYRVFVGMYLTRSEAEHAGQLLKEKKKIDSYIVARTPQ